MTYAVRLETRMAKPLREDQSGAVLAIPHFPSLRAEVEPDGFGGPNNWVDFVGTGFETKDEARQAGRMLKDVLALTGAIDNLGIKESKPPYVYEDGAILVRGGRVRLSISTAATNLENLITTRWHAGCNLTEQQRLSAALLNDALFVEHVEATLILRIAAIEALCEQQVKSNGKLEGTKKACRRKIANLLPHRNLEDFNWLYEQRGRFLHAGKLRGALGEASTHALELATELLEADLRRD